MAQITKPDSFWKCDKCAHEWRSRSPRRPKPRLCPSCKSVCWNDSEKQSSHTGKINSKKSREKA